MQETILCERITLLSELRSKLNIYDRESTTNATELGSVYPCGTVRFTKLSQTEML